MDAMHQCVIVAHALKGVMFPLQDIRSLALSLTYALTKGGLLSCLIFNGPKSFHNLNESRAFLEENQGGKMSARQGRQGEEGVERENEQQ